jgi:hypothetical protein
MDFLKEVLGEEVFSNVSEIVNKYNTTNPDKAIKIANLSTGKYVDVEKFNSMKSKYDEANTKLEQAVKNGNVSEQLKADYEKVKADLLEANNKLTTQERKSVVSKEVNPEYIDFVVYEVTKLMDDKTDFKQALDKYLESNPKYKVNNNRIVVSTQPKQSSNGSKVNSNEFMNDAIRGAFTR